jgi:hypothetical protein
MKRLRDRVVALERQIEAGEEALVAERAILAELERDIAIAAEILGDDARVIELGLRPLVAALVAALAALAATMLGYVQLVATAKGDWSAYWLFGAVLLAAMTVTGAGLFFAKRPGAGGSARVLLRRASVIALGLGLLMAGAATLVYLEGSRVSHDYPG